MNVLCVMQVRENGENLWNIFATKEGAELEVKELNRLAKTHELTEYYIIEPRPLLQETDVVRYSLWK